MQLLIKTLNKTAERMYSSHGHFHDGDAGLDLYILEETTVLSGETKLIKLGICCEPADGKAYYLFPCTAKSSVPPSCFW